MNQTRAALEAQQLLDNELLKETLLRLESSAIERAVNSKPSDHELRSSAMSDVRAVRSLRTALQSFIEEDQAMSKRKGKPA